MDNDQARKCHMILTSGRCIEERTLVNRKTLAHNRAVWRKVIEGQNPQSCRTRHDGDKNWRKVYLNLSKKKIGTIIFWVYLTNVKECFKLCIIRAALREKISLGYKEMWNTMCARKVMILTILRAIWHNSVVLLVLVCSSLLYAREPGENKLHSGRPSISKTVNIMFYKNALERPG